MNTRHPPAVSKPRASIPRGPRRLTHGDGDGALRTGVATSTRARAAIEAVAGEQGSGGIAGVALIGVLCALLVGFAPIGGALSARQQLQGAADAAALAAADTASGRVAGSPCEAASSISSALGTTLESCAVDPRGLATIRVSASVLGVGIDATARAGPPGLGRGRA